MKTGQICAYCGGDILQIDMDGIGSVCDTCLEEPGQYVPTSVIERAVTTLRALVALDHDGLYKDGAMLLANIIESHRDEYEGCHTPVIDQRDRLVCQALERELGPSTDNDFYTEELVSDYENGDDLC